METYQRDCQVRSLSEQSVLRYRVNGQVAGTTKKEKKKNKKSKNNRSAFACRSNYAKAKIPGTYLEINTG